MRADLAELDHDREMKLGVAVDDRAAKAKLDTLTRPRDVKVKVNDQGSIDKAQKSSVGLLSTLALLAPAAAPLTAVAIGGAAALGGLGAAGLLAFKGISDEMKRGTPLGLEYQAMLNGAKTQLTDLEHVAASGILTGFDNALGNVEAEMPGLRREIGLLSTSLGSDLSPVAHGLVSLFLQASPLLNDIAGGAHTLAVDFDQWASGPGGRAFIAYIASELPQVAHTLADVAGAGGHIVQALLPLGGPVLHTIDDLSIAIQHIPVSVIQQMFLAFAAYKTITLTTAAVEGLTGAMVKLGAVQGATGIAGAAGGAGKAAGSKGLLGGLGIGLGPFGLLAGGTVGLFSALASSKSQDASAFQQQVNALAANPAQLAADQRRLTILQSQQRQQRTTPNVGRSNLLGAPTNALDAPGVKSSSNLGAQIHDLQTLTTAAQKASTALAQQRAANLAMGLTADGSRDAITGETTALLIQIKTSDKLAAAGQGVIGTQIQAKQAAADATAALKANGRTLDLNTVKGRANQTALLNLGTALRAHVDAEAAAGHSTAQVNAVLSTSEDRLIKVAEKFGLSATQARKYADQVLGLPKTATVKFYTPGLNAALTGVNNLNGLLAKAYTLGGQAGARAAQAAKGNFGASGVPIVSTSAGPSPSGPGSAPGKRKSGPGHAGGGRVLPDGIYPVGERGVEWFAPDTAGTIIPNHIVAALATAAALATGPRPSAAGLSGAGGPAVQVNQNGNYFSYDPTALVRAERAEARKALAVAGIR